MLILKPYPHFTIWGGERLCRYIDSETAKIGHLYTVRGAESGSNEILNGAYSGENFFDYFLKNRKRWGLDGYEEFPITIALVDAGENLSVQVHPNKEIAEKYEGREIGKNEAFYLLEEPDYGRMINGCRCQTKEEIRRLSEEGRWDEIINYLSVSKGDYVYVPAGTMHAMTKGALCYEIEETCEYTYRLYDYDRRDENGNKRELDVEKAIDSINVSLKSYPRRYDKEEIAEEKFATKLLLNKNEYVNNMDSIVCLTFLEGGGTIDRVDIRPGMSVIMEPGDSLCDVEIGRAVAARILQRRK